MTEEIKTDLEVQVTAHVRVVIDPSAPADVYTRAETEEFQSSLYGDEVADRDGVLRHWAYNAIVNNVDDASRLDGWGDLDRGMVTFFVTYANVDDCREA